MRERSARSSLSEISPSHFCYPRLTPGHVRSGHVELELVEVAQRRAAGADARAQRAQLVVRDLAVTLLLPTSDTRTCPFRTRRTRAGRSNAAPCGQGGCASAARAARCPRSRRHTSVTHV